MKVNQLLPCPFCSSQPELKYDSGNEVWGKSWKVKCPCGIEGTKFSGSSSWLTIKSVDNAAIKSATDQWNRRPPLSY